MGIGIFIVVDPDEPKFKMEKERESSIEINDPKDDNGCLLNIESHKNVHNENKSPPIRIPVVNSSLPNPYTRRGYHFFNG